MVGDVKTFAVLAGDVVGRGVKQISARGPEFIPAAVWIVEYLCRRGVAGLLGEVQQISFFHLNIADGDEGHERPVADEQPGTNGRERARFEKAKEQSGKKVGERDALQDAHYAKFRPGVAETAIIKNAEQEQQHAADENAFQGFGAAIAFDHFGERKNQRHACHENEQREDQVVKAHPFPVRVLELVGERIGHEVRAHFMERLDQGIGPYDPEHVEAAQGVERHQSPGGLAFGGGFGFNRFAFQDG